MLLQLLISGIMLGGVYALTSIGLSLIFGVSKIINFAHGDFVVIGMYLTYSFYQITGISPYLSWVVVIPCSIILGWLVFLLLKRTIGVQEVNQIFITLGLSMVIQNVILMYFKSDYRTIRTIFDKNIKIGNIFFTREGVLAFLIAVVITAVFLWFLNKTDTGRAMKAVSQDRAAAHLMGVRVGSIDLLVFCLGIVFAGIAGSLLITMFAAYPTSGGVYNLLAWVTVVLGGLGNVVGALFAAFLIGVIEIISGYYLGADMRQVVYYVFFVIILIIRPQGLFSGIKFFNRKIKTNEAH
jgi:branched-chain amino acid transport system permease protein